MSVFGAGQYSMRVWLDPEKLKARSLTASDVIAGGAAAEPAGRGRADRAGRRRRRPVVPVTVNSRAGSTTPSSSRTSSSRPSDAGEITRLRDVGRVELGAQSYGRSSRSTASRRPASPMFQSPGANALNVQASVASAMKELAKEFPPGLVYHNSVRHDHVRRRSRSRRSTRR